MIPTTLEVFQVGSTPAFFVNGKIVLGGTVLAEAFKPIIDAAAEARRAAGRRAGRLPRAGRHREGEKKLRSRSDPEPP